MGMWRREDDLDAHLVADVHQVTLDLKQGQELLDDLVWRLRTCGVSRLVPGFDLEQFLDGIRLGMIVHDLVVGGAQQEQVIKAVARFVALIGVVAGALGAAGLDVADLTRERAAFGINQRQRAAGKGTPVAGDGKEPLDRRGSRAGHGC